jgi:hypothetical protein
MGWRGIKNGELLKKASENSLFATKQEFKIIVVGEETFLLLPNLVIFPS